MDPKFYITITLNTHTGPERFAHFSIGNDRDRAIAIFKQLQGSREVSEKNIIYFEFLETENGLPANLDFITCTLDQLAVNCRIITKNFFISENFDGS